MPSGRGLALQVSRERLGGRGGEQGLTRIEQQGLGTQALGWLRQQAAGRRELRLRTFHDSRAVAFYVREGFEVVRQDGVLLGLACPLPPLG